MSNGYSYYGSGGSGGATDRGITPQIPDFGTYPIPPAPTAADRNFAQQLWYNYKYGSDGKLGPSDFFRWIGTFFNPGGVLGTTLGRTIHDKWDARNTKPGTAPPGGGWQYNGTMGEYNNPNGYDFGDIGPQPEDPYKYNESGYRMMENMDWMGGNPSDPFGYQGYDAADEFVAGIGDRMAGRFSGLGMEAEADPHAPPGTPGFAGASGKPSSGMSVDMLDMPNGPDIPMISGPKWDGPPGLPWTYGADPRSYPYSYIPPGGSWANHPGAAPWPGAKPPGGPSDGLPQPVPGRPLFLNREFDEFGNPISNGRRQGGRPGLGPNPLDMPEPDGADTVGGGVYISRDGGGYSFGGGGWDDTGMPTMLY